MLRHNTRTPDVETASTSYATRFEGPVGHFLLQGQAASVERLLSSQPSRQLRVLDVGGGHAQLTKFLLNRGSYVWVQGSAAGCARRICPLIPASRGRLHFVVSTLWSLPFPDNYFDLVIGIRLLAHVELWRELLTEMARVCRHRLLVDYPPFAGLNMLDPILFPLKRRIEGDTRPYFSYRKAALIESLRHVGFRRFIVRKQFLVPMAVHRGLNLPRFSSTVEAIGRALGLTAMLGCPALLLAERKNASVNGVSQHGP